MLLLHMLHGSEKKKWLWNVTLYSLVEIYYHFDGAYCLMAEQYSSSLKG